ncbi:acyl-CoA dehydrogenase family protein [Candidatus Poriferisodalis sp.]|uniref:acyl-CoA dehydrogenase family protein n=1 Tax=Candidatus Poriferisodalis sp. TaxID=3101277 RepID=UPI003B016DDA
MNADAFRAHVRKFFTETTPAVLGNDGSGVQRAQSWRAALFDAGLAGFGYLPQHCGHDHPDAYAAIYAAESRRRVPREDSVFGIGVGMALPTIRDHASTSLQDRFLRPGLRGEEIWCQMYSEPGAGSDLAALQTRAERDGDEWVVSGQKVWTSGAQHSDFAILLARTDPDAPKHAGITMLVLPVRQDGVEVRPLRQMTGDTEFNEVFISEARIPGDWVVGQVNGGWSTAVALLAHERKQTGVASMQNAENQRSRAGRVPIPASQLIELARQRGRVDDPLVRQDLARLVTGERIVNHLRQRSGIHPSIGKLWRTRQGRAAAEVAASLCFPAGPAWIGTSPPDGHEHDDYFSFHILNARGMSLGGGTDEIQRNTLGERALGLPREAGPDRNTPFRDLPKN